MFDRLISFHARLAPNAIAFETPEGRVSYAGFDADISRVAAALADRVQSGTGMLVAIQVSNPYAHWLVLLALARLGVASMPAVPEIEAALLITDQPSLEQGGALETGRVHVSHAWLAAALGAPAAVNLPPPPRPETTGRMMVSSGTTGQRKAIALTFEAVAGRAKDYLMTIAGNEIRMMCLVGTDTTLGLMSGLAAWCGGGTLVFGPRGLAALAPALASLRLSTLVLATGQLAALLDLMPEAVTLPGTRVTAAGSSVSRTLAQRSLARMNGGFSVIYGSTEAGGLTIGRQDVLDREDGAVGYCYPGQSVEIVDEADRPVAAGTQGIVRARGQHMASGYMDDAAASAAVFRDGWFYPGDLGRMLPDGLLCIDGRTDEVMNLGGSKLLPAVFEDAALACPGVREAAAFAMPAPGGGQRVHVAIVRAEGFDQQILAQRLIDAVPGVMAPMLVWVDAIPRNAMAKADRIRLAAGVEAAKQRG